MVLETEHNRTARWSKDQNQWIVQDVPRYCWTDIKGNQLSEWFTELIDALDYAKKNRV